MNLQPVVEAMKHEETDFPTEFLLKQIENEISAGFVFVEKARNALKQSSPAEADSALSLAANTHREILKQVSDAPASQVRTVIHQLRELREAIDWLRETHFGNRPQ